MMVASATPATFIWNWMTKTRFKITFRTPANSRKTNGLLVSPAARRMEAQKLYTMLKVTPQKMIRM